MLFINYKGATPQQRYYSLGVKGNSNSNKITFVVETRQHDVSLLGLTCNLKVQDKEHKYLDLIQLDGIYDHITDTLSFEWSMGLKSTQYRNLELQLEFIDSSNIVWQTLIAELELSETIKVGEEVSEKELSIIKQMEDQIKDIEENALTKDSLAVLYMNENGTTLTPTSFSITQTALIIYGYKANSNDPIKGGAIPLYNNNEIELFNDNTDYLKVQTATANSKTTITINTQGMSYYRVMIINFPISLPL